MKPIKILGSVVGTVLAILALSSTASATTLYTNGVKQTGTVTLHATQTGSILIKDTGGAFANTCTSSTKHGWTTVISGSVILWAVNTFTFSGCTTEKVVVDAPGTDSIEVIGSGPNGTLRSNGAKLTVPSPFGSLTCTTSNTDIGTLTGTTSGTTKLDINAVLNCGAFLPSAKWEGGYIYTGHSIHTTP